jgi:cytochrome c peroxidase
MNIRYILAVVASTGLCAATQAAATEDKPSSYLPVADVTPFPELMKRFVAQKGEVVQKQAILLKTRYDLSNHPSKQFKMSRGKAVQTGVRVLLPKGQTWEQLAKMSPAEIKDKGGWPQGFLPLPHPHHEEGGMVFPQSTIDEVKRQTGRDLQRFDLDFDLPEHLLPEFPPAIYLTTRPDLGDVSKGQLVTTDNLFDLFAGILNPKQLEGMRLLVTAFPQQQFNGTAERRSVKASLGVACFDCHINGSTNGATHLAGDTRPQELRHRIDTPALRGVNIQQLFGSQRALHSVEDFTEFEQRAAYFDGDPVIATKKGVNILERGSQVHFMAEVQELLDFPPAPKLNVWGQLDRSKATEQEVRGEELFVGKARCITCHPAPYYTDNTLHNLQTERFFNPVVSNGHKAIGDGLIKTFTLRGIKDTPPYLHDGRLLTLEDTVEFFNLVLQLALNDGEKADLVAFMRAL